jgi:hypothetical protein
MYFRVKNVEMHPRWWWWWWWLVVGEKKKTDTGHKIRGFPLKIVLGVHA